MATVNVTTYGAVPNDETADNGPAFASAVTAAGRNGTVAIGPGKWHVSSYPVIQGAFPAVQADPFTVIAYHLPCDYSGAVTAETIQTFLAWHDGLGTGWGIHLEGLGVTP